MSLTGPYFSKPALGETDAELNPETLSCLVDNTKSNTPPISCDEVERCLPDANPDWSGAYTRLSVDIELYSANWFTQKGVRKVDIDNFLKSCLDSIFKHYAFDDSAIFHLNVQKLGTEFGDKTIVKIAHMDNN
jgi:hypothetical protein